MLEHRGPVWRHAPAALGTALLAVATVVGTQVALADAGNPRAPLSPYGEGGFTVGVAAVDKRITITSADDGSYVLGYTPTGGDVVLDLDMLSGDQAQPWWYDAASGRTLKMAALASAGVARFPAPKEGGGPAWVLVVDDVAAGYGSPDSEVVAQATGDDAGAATGGASPSGGGSSGGSSSNGSSSGAGAAPAGSTGSSGSGAADAGGSDGSTSDGGGAAGSGGAAAPGDDPASGSSPEQGRFGSSSGGSDGSGSGSSSSADSGSADSGSDSGGSDKGGSGSSSGSEGSGSDGGGSDSGTPEVKEPGNTGSDAGSGADSSDGGTSGEKSGGTKSGQDGAGAAEGDSGSTPDQEAPKKEAPEKEAPEKEAPKPAPQEDPKASADPSWDKLANCESSGNWAIDSGNGYYGGLQFDKGTWSDFGGTKYAPRADQATKEQQIEIASKVRDSRGGYSSWPACSSKLGLPK